MSSCKEQQKTNEKINVENTQEQFHLPNSEYVILTHQQEWFWVFRDRNSSEITPSKLSESELITIEKILTIAIKKNNENYSENKILKTDIEINLTDYKRQYVPIINTQGEKEVWVNFFCESFAADKWRTKTVQVEDGGKCYFNIKINLNTKEYYDLDINGSV